MLANANTPSMTPKIFFTLQVLFFCVLRFLNFLNRYQIAAGPNGLVTIASSAGNIVANFQIDNPLQQDAACTSPRLSGVVENAADYAFSSPVLVAPGRRKRIVGRILD